MDRTLPQWQGGLDRGAARQPPDMALTPGVHGLPGTAGWRAVLDGMGAPLWVLVVLLSSWALSRTGLAGPGWLVCYVVALIWMVLRFDRLLAVLVRGWPILLLPLLAIVSVLWSVDPAQSARAAFQFTMTILISVMIAATVPPERGLALLFFAGTLTVALSLLNDAVGFSPPAYEIGNGAFIGIFPQKNVAGSAFVLTATGLGFMVLRRPVLWIVAVPVLALLLWMILRTDSTSSLLSFGMLALPLVLARLGRRSATGRVVLLITVLLAAALPVVVIASGIDLIGWGLDLVGKTRDLTGRTDIWSAGYDVWQRFPVFGTGYAAFWGNEHLFPVIQIVHGTIDDRLNGFHNLIVEAAVTLGAVGVIVLVVVLAWTVLSCLSWQITEGSAAAHVWTGVVVISIIVSMQGVSILRQHEIYQILITMAVIYAQRSPPLRFRL